MRKQTVPSPILAGSQPDFLHWHILNGIPLSHPNGLPMAHPAFQWYGANAYVNQDHP